MKLRRFIGFHGRFSWLLPLVLLALVLVVVELLPLDVWIQDCFYKADRGWLIGDNAELLRFLYYQGPKITVIPLFVLVVLVHAVKSFRKFGMIPWKHIYVLLCLALIPGVVAVLKKATNIPYPRKIVRYGGIEQRRTLTDVLLGRLAPVEKRYAGWPAGHASGGFGLMGIAFASEDRRRRRVGFAVASLLGFFMGIGHTLDGNHFLSHTLVSFLLAWILAAVLYRLMLPLLESCRRRREQY